MKEEKKEVTNLQDDTENLAEDSVKTDNLSGTDENENEGTSEDEKIESGDGDDTEETELAPSQSSWEEKYDALNDKHLRLMAEYDNFRKRTIREKADLIKSGGATALTNLLPVIDDFERAMSSLQTTEDLPSVVEGIKLIYDKFIAYLAQQGVTVIDAVGQPFDTEFFEAVATIPAPEEDKKGKVIDCVQTGYKLYDKVLRHSKVVVGE